MPRYMDFRKNKTKPTAAPRPVPVNKPVVPTPAPLAESIIERSRASKNRRLPKWLWVVIILIIIAAIIGIAYLFKGSTVKSSPKTSQAPKTTSGIFSGQSSTGPAKVTFLNSGADKEVVNKTIAAIKSQDYRVDNQGESIVPLDQTYIWYQEPFADDAAKIQSLLAGRKVAIHPYVGTGEYQILVQLGP